MTTPAVPLPGPDGLFTVSHAPRFLLDSNAAGWQGAFFTEFWFAPAGHVRHTHERYCLQRTFKPVEASARAGQSWELVPAGVTVLQPGDEQRGQWRGAGLGQFLFLAPERAEEILSGVPGRLSGCSPLRPVRSRLADLIFDGLAQDLVQGSPAGPLVGDSLIAALFAHLSGLAETPVRAGLAPPLRERVIEFIDANLARPVALAELAAVAAMGVRQFCRAFRASTGDSPHQYLLNQRVERAKALIGAGRALSEVALDSGFADQSQLTRTFVQRVGITPAVYRASLRS